MIEYPEICRLVKPLIFDSHAHLDDEKFEGIRDTLIPSMKNYGVCGIITCGCDKESSQKALSLAKAYDFIYAAVGIHPENINSDTTVEDIRNLAKNSKCVAIGEIGLDYYWNQDSAAQIDLFEKQIVLAKELDLPIIVHDREAHADTLEILKKYKPKGVLHCFSGSSEMAKEVIKLGMYIGVGGVVTFKNARKLLETLPIIPLDKLLLETDCPYLAPEPFRGKICHSGFIYYTANRIAEILNLNLETVLEETAKNAKTLFSIV